MKAHIALANPEAKSFNGHLSRLSQNQLSDSGWQVTLSNLYGMGFDPCEGAHHFENRQNTAEFHAQTEQRFSTEMDTTPGDITDEIQHDHEPD